MRFDTSRGVPASELLATLDADELTALFRRYGEEPQASRIARAIVGRPADGADRDGRAPRRARRAPVVPPIPRSRRRVHPATRVFQALRIAVNEELEALQAGLAAALDLLRPGGRLASSATTRSRTASSSASSRPSGAAACARPRSRSASAAGTRGCASSARQSLTPDGGRDRGQPQGPERPAASRRATRRLSQRPRYRKEEEPHEQAPPVQSPQPTAVASTRFVSGPTGTSSRRASTSS